MESFMKKSKGFIIFTIMTTFFLNSTYDSDRIAQKLTNAAPKAFGSFRMFNTKIDEQGLVEWDAVINEGLNLVKQANKNSKKSQAYCTRIINANNDLVNTIKFAYNVMFLPHENKERLSAQESRIVLENKQKFMILFTKIQNDMADLIKEVRAKGLFKSSIMEKDILIEIANYISSYADNAIGSMDFKLSTENKVSADTERPWVARR